MSASAKKHLPKLGTLTLVVVALFCAYLLYVRYTDRPWTRDGQVRADIIKVVPRVDGYIVKVAVQDNQFVRKGELLFQIDQSDYQLAVDKAQVQLDQSREDVESLAAAVRAAEAAIKEAEAGVVSATAMIAQRKAQLEEARREAARAKRLADKKAGSVETAQAKAAAVDAFKAELDSAHAGLNQAKAAVITSKADRDEAQANLGEPGEANVRVRQAKVQLNEAKLKLAWTTIKAPSDGYITNLYVNDGSYAVVGSALVAFVDSNTFRVHAYFKETKLRHIQPGDRAIVTLMGHHDQPIEGVVDTIGRATNPPDIASTEGEMGVVPQIEPTFDWVRLAQRVPVTIRL
ncbi:MAG: HlyD family secretion protein, partial [Planctomycetota bacterium]|nr:HlyD family secretion protein [Planctomycetota bacterium]